MLLSSRNFFSEAGYDFICKASQDNLKLHAFTGILDVASLYFPPMIALSFTAKVIIAAQKAGEASMNLHCDFGEKKASFESKAESVASGAAAINFGIEAAVYPCFAVFLLVPNIDVAFLALCYVATKIAGYKITETCRDIEINNIDRQYHSPTPQG